MKNEKFTIIDRIFREINSLGTCFVKTLLSRDFCKKSVRVFLYYHTVRILLIVLFHTVLCSTTGNLRLSKYMNKIQFHVKIKGAKPIFPKLFFNVIVVVCITTSKTQMSQSFFKTSSSFMRCKCHFALESEPLSETETTSAMSVYQIFRNISPMIYHNLSRFKLRLQNLVAKCFGLAEF